jgi:hypothetical protein
VVKQNRVNKRYNMASEARPTLIMVGADKGGVGAAL